MVKQLGCLLILLALSSTAMAQKSRFKVFKENSKQRATIKNSRPLSVFYEKISWNQNATEIEKGFLYLRDRDTGELIELTLSETEPNSGIFNMDFPIGALKTKTIAAEVYSAPQSMLKGKNRKSLMKDLIKDGSVKRKPFLLRVLRKKGQIVDIFDNKEAALASYNKYREQMGLSPEGQESVSIIEVANKEKPVKKKVIDTSTLQSMFLANENDLAATNAKNKELRDVMRKIEEKRRKQVKDNAKSWGSSKKKKNANKANNIIKKAVNELKAAQFKQSMENFFKASDLIPDSEDTYEQYGISLHRDKKYNQSIVILELSKPSANRINEKNFYLGLNHFQLKDYPEAVKYFDMVLKTGDKTFGPTAAFYKGSALIEMGEYEKSKVAFQYVLDNSNNPEMDKRAEKYIEYSLDRKRLEEKRANWFFIDGVLGLIYDSNIVLANDQARDQGTVTNENGWRTLLQVAPRVRPYYSDSDEISVAADITYLKSFDEGFGSNPTAETADPLLYAVKVPWTHRGTLDGKGYFFDLIPSFETIIMDLDGTGSATITDSIKLAFNNTLVVNKNWIAKGDWFFSSNDSNILGDERSADSSAGGLKLSSIFILNKDLEQYLIPDFGYQINDAKGSTFAFNRIDLGVTYTQAVFGDFTWNNRFAYFLANYESNRVDNNYTFTSGLSTRLSAHWNWGFMGSYILNDSTTNAFDKYNFVTTFSFSY